MDKVVKSVVIAALANFQMGFHMGVFSPALLFLRDTFPSLQHSPAQQSLLVAIAIFGAMIGAPTFARLSDHHGRLTAILWVNAIYLLGTVLLMSSTRVWMLMVVRGLIGMAMGGSTSVVPVYVNEISPAQRRGRYGTIIQFAVTSGILVSYLVGYATSGLCAVAFVEPWRLQFGFGLLAPLAFFLSQSQLIIQEDRNDISPDIGSTLEQSPLISDAAGKSIGDISDNERIIQRVDWVEILSDRDRLKQVLLVLALQLCQQLSGFNTIVFYSGVIFTDLGFDRLNALLASCISTLPQLFALIASSRLVDGLGRRPTLLISMLSLAGCLISIGLLSFLWRASNDISRNFVLIGLVLLARISFSIGLGPVPAIVSPELLPAEIRNKAMGLASLVNWAVNGAVTISFLPLVQLEQIIWLKLGYNQDTRGDRLVLIYWLYSVLLLFGSVFVARFIPETKHHKMHN